MDGVFCFDDSLFAHGNDKSENSISRPKSYNAKWCPPLWYVADNIPPDDYVAMKHRADQHYSKCQFTEAITAYLAVLNVLPLTNSCVRRDVFESLVHCYLATDKLRETTDLYDKLVKLASNRDHELQNISLHAEILHATKRYSDEKHCLAELITHSPNHSDYWRRLATCYHCQASVASDPQEGISKLKALTCLVKLRQILTYNFHKTCSFARSSAEMRLQKVTAMITDLGYDVEIIETAAQAVRRQTVKDGNDREEQINVASTPTQVSTDEQFDDMWFSWIKRLQADEPAS